MWIIVAQLPAIIVSYPLSLIIADLQIWPAYLLFLSIGVFIYITVASRFMFKLSWIAALWRLPLLVTAFFISHIIYRLLQLTITVLLIEV